MGKLTDWRVVRETPHKRVLMRYDAATDEIVVCEEWYDEAALEQTREQAEKPIFGTQKAHRPLAVIPDSVMSRAIKEGWLNDQDQWAKWAADADNRRLQLTD